MSHLSVSFHKPPSELIVTFAEFFCSRFRILGLASTTIFEFEQRKPISINVYYHVCSVGVTDR